MSWIIDTDANKTCKVMNKGVQELNLVTSYFNDPKKMHIHKRIPFYTI